MPLLFQPFHLSSEWQRYTYWHACGFSPDGTEYASLETGVARYCNNWSCYKGWEIYLEHR